MVAAETKCFVSVNSLIHTTNIIQSGGFVFVNSLIPHKSDV